MQNSLVRRQNVERFTILRVILAQGPCYSSLCRSNFSICTAEASTTIAENRETLIVEINVQLNFEEFP